MPKERRMQLMLAGSAIWGGCSSRSVLSNETLTSLGFQDKTYYATYERIVINFGVASMPAAMMSNFSIYMRNDAIQTGAWVFVKEDGEYRAFGSPVSSVPDQLVYTSRGTWSMFNSSGIMTQYGNTGGYEYIVNTFQPYEITINGFVQNGSVLFPNFYIAREFVDPENS